MSKKKNIQEALRRFRKNAKEREKRFRALSKPEQRVAIARDVLKQLDARHIKAESGEYGDFGWGDEEEKRGAEENLGVDLGMNPQFRDVLFASGATGRGCSVCALGAVFCSAANLGDKVDASVAGELGAFGKHVYLPGSPIEKYFSQSQLGLIESAFERATCHALNRGVCYKKTFEATYVFDHFDEDQDEERLRAIMNNIIKNKGTFNPKTEKSYAPYDGRYDYGE